MWHYECNGQPVGPVSAEAIRLLIRDGVLVRSTLVWKAGMSDWSRADATDFFRFFDSPPPIAPRAEPSRNAADEPSIDRVGSIERADNEAGLSGGFAEANRSETGTALSPPPTHEPIQGPDGVIAGAAKPLGGIVLHAQIAVIAFILATVGAVLSDLMFAGFIQRLLSGGFQSDAELDRQALVVDAFSLYAAIVFLVVFLWSAVVIARWTYRAMKNLRVMGYKTTVSPGWTIGWHFIPFALLWMPFTGMAQIWRGSVHGAPTGNNKLPISMRLWWACWLFGNWAFYGAFQMQETGFRVEDYELVQTAIGVGILGSGLHIVSALLLLGLMRKVTRAQIDQPAMQFN